MRAGRRELFSTLHSEGGILPQDLLQRIVERVAVKRLAAEIVAAALALGSRDNCTAVVAEWVDP